MQLAGVNVPLAPVANWTWPVGAVGLPFVSVTVAVHAVEVATVTVAGAQLSRVEVPCSSPTVTFVLPLLVRWPAVAP